MDRMRTHGFTLVELMVTLAIAAVLVGIAIPNMRDFIWNNRLASAANDLLRSVNQARSEAIKRQSGLVTLCATANPNAADAAMTCSNGAFSGWFVFADADSDGQHDGAEAVLSRGAAHGTVTVKSDNDGIVCFNQTGFAPVNCNGQAPTDNVVLCDSRGNTQVGANSTARAMFITQTGRARVSRLYVDVGNALASIGGACP